MATDPASASTADPFVCDYRSLSNLTRSLTFVAIGAVAALIANRLLNAHEGSHKDYIGVAVAAIFSCCLLCLGGYMLVRFFNEQISFDGETLTWVDWRGRTRCQASINEIMPGTLRVGRISGGGPLTHGSWKKWAVLLLRVDTTKGMLAFDDSISHYNTLHDLLRAAANRNLTESAG